jgi:hypothetical protein
MDKTIKMKKEILLAGSLLMSAFVFAQHDHHKRYNGSQHPRTGRYVHVSCILPEPSHDKEWFGNFLAAGQYSYIRIHVPFTQMDVYVAW